MTYGNFKKPYYFVYAYELSAGEIWVNDVPLVNWSGPQTKDGVYNGEIPINQAILENGSYFLKCILKPRYHFDELDLSESQDIFALNVQCREVDDLRTKVEILSTFENPIGKWNEKEKKFVNDAFKNRKTFEMEKNFEVTELQFKLDGWQNSINLSDMKLNVLLQEVSTTYNQIHAVLAQNNAAKFLELSKEKMKLQEEAFYFSDERKSSFKNSILALFDKKLEIDFPNPSTLKLQILGHGKLVRLVRDDGSSAIQFKSPTPEETGNVEFEIKLHKRLENTGFTII